MGKSKNVKNMIKVYQRTYNGFQQNMSILVNDAGEAILVDPGCYDRAEEEDLKSFIEELGVTPVRLINTHFHLDHVLGNQFVASTYGLKVESHTEGEKVLAMAGPSAAMYGFNGYKPSPEMKVTHAHGDVISFGNTQLKVLFVPGHCPGHIALVSDADQFVIGGDVLFRGSIGRTDLPGGDFEILEQSIKNHMYALPDDYTVYCGHGPTTTIGFEKANNPFVRG